MRLSASNFSLMWRTSSFYLRADVRPINSNKRVNLFLETGVPVNDVTQVKPTPGSVTCLYKQIHSEFLF